MTEDNALNLDNICNGGVPEVFERELGEVLKNIADVNTDPEEQRKITFEFIFEPFKDRSGAMVRFRCKSKVAPVEEVAGQMFVQRRGVNLTAIAHDPRQARMFDSKAAAAGEKAKDVQ
jgi:hypothetical protein